MKDGVTCKVSWRWSDWNQKYHLNCLVAFKNSYRSYQQKKIWTLTNNFEELTKARNWTEIVS